MIDDRRRRIVLSYRWPFISSSTPPIPVENQVCLFYAVTHDFLKEVEVKDVAELEAIRNKLLAIPDVLSSRRGQN